MEPSLSREPSGGRSAADAEAGGIKADFWTKARVAALASVVTIAVIFVAGIMWKNWAPFGARVSYHIEMGKASDYATAPAPLTPSAMVGKDGNGALYQVEEMTMATEQVRFTLRIPYDSLERLTFEVEYGGDPEELLIAVANPADGQLITQPLHNRSLNNLGWHAVSGEGVTLFQRNAIYPDVSSFFNSFYAARDNAFAKPGNQVASYYFPLGPAYLGITPERINAGTEIGHSFRGKHVMTVYVKGEPLSMEFDWRDLNWYEGPDPLNVYVYNADSALVYSESFGDDGDESPSSVPSAPRHCQLFLPNLWEGAYRVEIGCGSDVVFSGIRSGQGYLVFNDKVFVADHVLYGLSESKPCTVYCNGKRLNVETWHPETVQTITLNGIEKLRIEKEKVNYSIGMDGDVNEISTQTGDVTLSSPGAYFSFSRQSLFYPVTSLSYSRLLPLSDIGYVIADYVLPEKLETTWKQTSVFDMAGVEIGDREIQVMLIAPGLATGAPIALRGITAVAEK